MEARDADAFESALRSAYQAGLSLDLSEVLAAALLMPWHYRHEDLARALQQLRDPRTVDALFHAAFSRHAYLDYDENFGLARKCTWALADIGTAEAKRRLEELAAGENESVAGYAQRRLDRWESEKARKGTR
jgi:hypothetical protein